MCINEYIRTRVSKFMNIMYHVCRTRSLIRTCMNEALSPRIEYTLPSRVQLEYLSSMDVLGMLKSFTLHIREYNRAAEESLRK